MKKFFTLFSLLVVMILLPQNVKAQTWSYDFEDFGSVVGTGNKKNAIDVQLNGVKWHMCGVASSVDGNDFKEGTCSMKLYGEQDCGWKAPDETTNFTLAEKRSIGTVSFTFAPNQMWAGNPEAQVDWIVQFSADGNTWTTVGDSFRAWEEPMLVEREINQPSAQIRIIRADYLSFDFTKGQGYSFIANMDNIAMTEFSGTEAPELFTSVGVIDFGQVEKGQVVEKTFTLTHKSLSSPVELSIEGADAAAYTILTKELSAEGTDEIKISFKPFKKGNFNAVFVAKSGVLKATVDLQAIGTTAEGVKFTGGKGTEAEPYLISCKEDLFELSDDVEKGMNAYEGTYFKMTNDIDMENVDGFRSIGNNFDREPGEDGTIRPFSGIFDGDGHKVYNIKGAWDDYGFVGLFGIIMNATIKNVTIAKSNIYGDLGAAALVGVGMMDNTISNCHTTADVTVTNRKFYVAGICSGLLISGSNGSVIEGCTNHASVNGVVGYSAGILATNGQVGTQILRCGNYGEITDNNLHVAGICSSTKSGITIIDSYNIGNVTRLALEGAQNAIGAGILADAGDIQETDEIVIKNCYNLGQFNVIGQGMHPIFDEELAPYYNTVSENNYFSEDVNSFDFEGAIHVPLADMNTQKFVDMLNNNRPEGPWMIKEGVNGGYPVPENTDVITGIDCTVVDASSYLSYVAGMVYVTGMNSGARVVVVDIAGRIVKNILVDVQGNAVIDMTSFPAGTYFISVDGMNMKIAK